MNSFGVQTQPRRISLSLSPEYYFVTETRHHFFFNLKECFSFKKDKGLVGRHWVKELSREALPSI